MRDDEKVAVGAIGIGCGMLLLQIGWIAFVVWAIYRLVMHFT